MIPPTIVSSIRILRMPLDCIEPTHIMKQFDFITCIFKPFASCYLSNTIVCSPSSKSRVISCNTLNIAAVVIIIPTNTITRSIVHSKIDAFSLYIEELIIELLRKFTPHRIITVGGHYTFNMDIIPASTTF